MLLKVPSVPYKATSIIKKIDVLRLMSETDEKKREMICMPIFSKREGAGENAK